MLLLKTLGQARDKTDWRMPTRWLMSSRFHLVIETACGNLVNVRSKQ